MNPPGKCLLLGPDCSMKISADFIHFYPFKKPHLCSIWCGPPSRWLSFEHSSAKMGSQWTFNHCIQHCVPVLQLHIPHQNSTSTAQPRRCCHARHNYLWSGLYTQSTKSEGIYSVWSYNHSVAKSHSSLDLQRNYSWHPQPMCGASTSSSLICNVV